MRSLPRIACTSWPLRACGREVTVGHKRFPASDSRPVPGDKQSSSLTKHFGEMYHLVHRPEMNQRHEGREEAIMGSGGVERASITINAPIDVVWSVFTDVERWPTWASSFTSVELINGPMRLGAKARIRQPRLPTVVWEVTKWEPGRSWTWTATGPGARTEASHNLTASGRGTVAEQSIVSSGPVGRLLAFAWRSLTRRYLAIEAEGLKQRSEQVAASSSAATAARAR